MLKRGHPQRPFAVAAAILILLLLAWLPVAWWLSTVAVRTEARNSVDDIRARRMEMLRLQTASFAEHWRSLRNAPEIVANTPVVLRALAMPAQTHVNEANQYLGMLAERAAGDAIWVTDPQGRVVLASDASAPGSLFGRTLKDHDFFLKTLDDRGGLTFGYGMYTDQPGFYFSAPIRVGDFIVGVATVKARLDALDARFGDPFLLISDHLGVIVVSKARELLWHTLPGAGIDKVSPSARAVRYGSTPLRPAELSPANSPLLPAGLYRKGKDDRSYLFLSQSDASLDRLTMHMLVPLPELNRLPAQQRLYFGLIGGSGALLLALAVVLSTYLRHVKRLGRQIASANRELQRQADSDFLTGCANRRKFERVLGVELARSHRYGNPLTVAIIDIDFFKRINDSYGHPVGDAGLVHLVETISATIRDVDLLGRTGGEEFALMLPQTAVAGAEQLLERLRAMFEQGHFTADGKEVRFTVSIGYTMASGSDDVESLLKRADEALYAAKQGGRNRICLAAAPAVTQASA
ncbi:sensor domain-containing diguanylate cyclase [Jeongeupia sp. HS-3]|uniref:sensor domain-containing diguanylate cyclase n=1 Tax=Jeongeupia sp. HS-3 TaxID=1009682 RepID=UPI001911020E|nr:sensor domain-containing diguanylate cyclase [Jeongeupia sp. HS-3]